MSANSQSIAHLEAGGLLLTPDLRQARILRHLHDRAQADAGRKVWPSAQVLPLDTWLALQWQLACADRLELPGILPLVALRWLWSRQALRNTPALLDPADLGNRARTSWLRLRAHGGDLASLSRWPLTRDQQAFIGWAGSVESDLKARNRCDPGDLARLLVEAGALPTSGSPILLAGFRRLTPAEEALFAALSAAGRSVLRHEPAPATGACFRHGAVDPETERVAMLAWLRERVARWPAGAHALIVPDLDANRGALERLLSSVLQPGLELPDAGTEERVFDLAGGNALALQAVVDAALAALGAAAGAVDWTVASRLLLTAHIRAAESERAARIAAELSLRDAQAPVRIRGPQLAERASRSGALQFAAALTAATAALAGPERRSASSWAEAFGSCLASWGWPGEVALESREYQAARRFREILRELAALSLVASDLGAFEALAELRRLAAAPFQPESGEPAVFVLDAREDPGVHFDSLWVAGLTATAWPPAVAVDPLLPIEIQRQLGMPRVTPESCVTEARAIIDRWRARTDALVLSWPEFENDTKVDGTPLLPADTVELPLPAVVASRERLGFESRRLEPVPDAPLPPLAGGFAKGGARLLELQAKCPFRAFAELRLGARPLEEPQSGFDRRTRGILLHRALQDLWSGLGGQAALASLDAAARNRLAARAVEQAMAGAMPVGTGPGAIALESEWQRRAVDRLLQLDLARTPFEVVETERALTLTIAGLELRLRVDRVDRIGAELVVIDYKTGRAQASAWRGARMDAPQLPLYALLHPDQPTGIAFAAAGRTGAMYVGVGRDGSAIEGVESAQEFPLTEDRQDGFSWQEITAQWRSWLERLARDFASGQAEVDPKLAAETCRRCHLAALCRVERRAAEDAGDEAADGG